MFWMTYESGPKHQSEPFTSWVHEQLNVSVSSSLNVDLDCRTHDEAVVQDQYLESELSARGWVWAYVAHLVSGVCLHVPPPPPPPLGLLLLVTPSSAPHTTHDPLVGDYPLIGWQITSNLSGHPTCTRPVCMHAYLTIICGAYMFTVYNII